MLMVIFGAGASYDSSPTYTVGMVSGAGYIPMLDDHYRPPLARDLFANRPMFIEALDRFPQCKTIVPRLRDPAVISGQKSIETLLQEIEEEARGYARGPQELAAVRCYLQHAISQCQIKWREITRGITNYLSLLREIERAYRGNGPACIVTFNYDTLLEDALTDLGLTFERVEDYSKGRGIFRLFKLHGSVNWAQEVKIQLPANVNLGHPPSVLRYLIEHAAELEISDRFVLCSPTNMGVVNGRAVFPAIAIPVEKKQTFQCPQYMVDELTALLPQVSKILVIGWRATEDHFVHLLKRNLKQGVYLSIVAGDRGQAEGVRARIHQNLPNNQPSSSPEPTGFTEFIRTRRLEQILSG